jgi:hypothetical protein
MASLATPKYGVRPAWFRQLREGTIPVGILIFASRRCRDPAVRHPLSAVCGRTARRQSLVRSRLHRRLVRIARAQAILPIVFFVYFCPMGSAHVVSQIQFGNFKRKLEALSFMLGNYNRGIDLIWVRPMIRSDGRVLYPIFAHSHPRPRSNTITARCR